MSGWKLRDLIGEQGWASEDGLGFIEVVDFMGGDLQVVNSARISFAKQIAELGDGDRRLIDFLMRHRHGTPFESSCFTFHVKCPIVVAREWMRHRIGSFNEVSGRYVELEREFYVPPRDAVREQRGKPGAYTYERVADDTTAEGVRTMIQSAYDSCWATYRTLLGAGIAKEQARLVLPVGIYTQFYWTVNARSLMNFLSLRMAPNAMREIRDFARSAYKAFRFNMPETAEAFELNGRAAP